MALWSRGFGAVIMAVVVAANLYAEKKREYKHLPVEVGCGIYGRFVRCSAVNALDLVERVWVYNKYTTMGEEDGTLYTSGPIPVTEDSCTPITFYATDSANWSTFVISVNVRLHRGRATFKGCEQKNVKETYSSRN